MIGGCQWQRDGFTYDHSHAALTATSTIHDPERSKQTLINPTKRQVVILYASASTPTVIFQTLQW